MQTFDLNYLKKQADAMSKREWEASREWAQPEGETFRYMINPLIGYAESIDFNVIFQDPSIPLGEDLTLHGEVFGLCQRRPPWDLSSGDGTIYINPKTTSNEKVRVLSHELTHALGANCDNYGTDEVTAEATAYAVCREIGLDTYNFSCPYVAFHRHLEDGAWFGNEINRYASEILNGVNQSVQLLGAS